MASPRRQQDGGAARSRGGTAVVAATLLATATLGTGIAAAYWTAPGTGSGTAAAGNVTASVTLSPGTPADTLYPGAHGDIVLTATNANTAQVVLPSLVLDTAHASGGIEVGTTFPDCPSSSFTYTTQSNGGTGFTVPGRGGGVDGQASLTLTQALAMSVHAPDACQGATVTVYLKAP